MGSITIRNLDDRLKANLRVRAASHGVSMEQEVRNILQNTLMSDAITPNGLTFSQRINQRFKGVGPEDFSLPTRHPARPLPDFDTP